MPSYNLQVVLDTQGAPTKYKEGGKVGHKRNGSTQPNLRAPVQYVPGALAPVAVKRLAPRQ